MTKARQNGCARKLIKPRIHADETRIETMALEHEKITEQIIGAAFEVHGILGTGFLEKVYQRAMQVELKKVEFKRSAYSGESASHPNGASLTALSIFCPYHYRDRDRFLCPLST